MIQPLYNFMFVPFIPPNCDYPPTLYSVLNSIVNGEKEEEDYTKIKDLASEGRTTIFNFDYPLSDNINKEDFETMILKHYMMRRIGFETVTAFRLALDSKLNEVMPMYNKMFDALENWNIFNDGETTVRSGTENRTGESQNNTKTENNTTNTLENKSQTDTNNTSDRRNSELPQNQLSDLRDGNYVTNYNYDTDINHGEDSSKSNGSSESNGVTNTNGTTKDNNIYSETVTRSPADKIAILKEMQENIKSIYTLIYKDLDVLFFGLV